MSIPNLLYIEYGHIYFWTKIWFWERPFILSIQNLLCIEYDHLEFWVKTWFGERHDLEKDLLFCPSKIYSALYVHPDFRTNFNKSTCHLSTWLVLVLGIYLEYLVYLSTWSTVLDPNPVCVGGGGVGLSAGEFFIIDHIMTI